MCIRIQFSRATVKDLHSRLQHAYQRDDVRLVRRTTVLLDLLVHQVPVEVLSQRWGLSRGLQGCAPTDTGAKRRLSAYQLPVHRTYATMAPVP